MRTWHLKQLELFVCEDCLSKLLGRLQLSQSSLMAKITKPLGDAAEYLNALLGGESEF